MRKRLKQSWTILFMYLIANASHAQHQAMPEPDSTIAVPNTSGAYAMIAEPKVDNRIELLSIVFRLAGSDEYNMSQFQQYTDQVDKHYDPFQDHPLITYVKSKKDKNGIAYDAVMSMAIHLDSNLNPRMIFDENTPDPRWGKIDHPKFVKLLQDFYSDTDSERFFKSVEPLQREVSRKYYPIYGQLDAVWFTDFFGTVQNEKFHIVNALGNGGANYGTAINLPDGKREVYAIIGVWDFDSEGMAQFPVDPYFLTMVHEFSHSFVNPLLNDQQQPNFKKTGDEMYAVVESKMQDQAYQEWVTMMNEALVRATVIKYMIDHDFPEAQVDKERRQQSDLGFYWVNDLVKDLENYASKRDQYPTFEEYMPMLAKAYERYSENLKAMDTAASR